MPDVGRRTLPTPWVRVALAVLIGVVSASRVQAQLSPQFCGALTNGFGPFDYRYDRFKPSPGDQGSYHFALRIVEDNHFTPEVEALIRGKTNTTPQLDLDYTIRAFPNHHRVLAALIRLWERTKSPQPGNLPRPIECYFERAVRFQPDDTTVRMLYAMFLHKDNRHLEALRQLEGALSYAQDNAFTHYNIGLVYLDVNEPTKALAQAHRALALGFPRMELKSRLVALGKWQEPLADLVPLDPATPVNATK